MDITYNILTNASTIEAELQWLEKVIEKAIDIYFNQKYDESIEDEVKPPVLTETSSFYASLVAKHNMGYMERLLLILSLAPHLRPQVLDSFFIKNNNLDRNFTEFGGIKGSQHAGFLPTGETFAFITSANSMQKRFYALQLLSKQHYFSKHNILKLLAPPNDEPFLCGALQISQEYLSLITSGKKFSPEYNTNFPAKLLTTNLKWEDLILAEPLMNNLNEVRYWIEHKESILRNKATEKFISPGYKALFYGPPGTGKTLAATLLGKVTQLDVYRIDLSMVVSKYIGETEKNLGYLFDIAENKNWILFFDEADALFGKRSQTNDSHDRYANQEVAYLLQRIEDYRGVAILASNFKNNIDQAFARRFQSTIYFAAPGTYEKETLLSNMFSPFVKEEIDYHQLAERYDITGGLLVNVLRHSLIEAHKNNRNVIAADIEQGIEKEYKKEGKIF